MYLSLIDEEFVGYILLHCAKARVLWKKLFALYRVSKVLSSSVRETLLG